MPINANRFPDVDHSCRTSRFQAPERWVQHYVKKFGDEKPYTGQAGYLPCRYPHATYAAMISYFDEQIGQLIEKLKAEHLYENTLIVFTSDNGPTFNGGSDSPWFNSGDFSIQHTDGANVSCMKEVSVSPPLSHGPAK